MLDIAFFLISIKKKLKLPITNFCSSANDVSSKLIISVLWKWEFVFGMLLKIKINQFKRYLAESTRD